MLKTLRYIFSALFVLTAILLQAQNSENDKYEVSLGVDLSRFAMPIINNDRFGWEISGDAEIIQDLFATVEFGSQTTNLKKPEYHYTSNGAYTRFGVDYNYMKHLDDRSHDKLFIGLRYGFTTFYHQADNITLKNPIWGNLENNSVDRSWLGAHWFEIATGMRAHLFNNFYLGWSVRFKMKLNPNDKSTMQPYYIPGFGRGWNSSGVGVNYSLYYKIPLIKKGRKGKK